MITGSNPFKKSGAGIGLGMQSSTEGSSADSSANRAEASGGRNAATTTTAATAGRSAPPAPLRRASAKRLTSSQVSATGGEPAIFEEPQSGSLDDADRDELDELERQHDAAQSSAVRASIDSQRSVNPPPTRSRRSSSLLPSATSGPTPTLSGGAEPLPHAPQINGASTPRPFGMDLPTPDIISRDLTRSSEDGGGRRSSIGGGVTSAGLVDPTQKLPPAAESLQITSASTITSTTTAKKSRRRPSTTGPILCVLGCGTMGRSILSGVLDAIEESGPTMDSNGLLPPARFMACVRREAAAAKLREEWGDQVSVVLGPEANARAVGESDYVLLGSKPQVARDILSSNAMQDALAGKVLISILAGTTIATLQSLCPRSKIVRVMPNTPSRIRKGMSVIVSGAGVSDAQLDLVAWIFDQVGKTLVMDEKHIDAATAMCGSGPAFMAVILESMTDGGVMMGIPRAQAEELAAQTMLGTASMVQAGQHPALIRNAVATPGGCTIGGLLEMEDGKIRSTMARTIQTATNIAAGLGKQ